MNFKQINRDSLRDLLGNLDHRILLSIGILSITVAVVGLLVLWTRESPPPPRNIREHNYSSFEGDVSKLTIPPVEVNDVPTEDELRQEVIQMILGRIEDTDDSIEEDWFKKAHQLIKSKSDLNLFFDDYLVIGTKRKASYERRQKVVKKPALDDPLYFDSVAASALVDSDASEKGLLRGVQENLAYALLLVQEERGDLDLISPHFMVGFFNKLHTMYEILERRSIEKNIRSDYWTKERIRHLEAAIVSRFFMLKKSLEKTRARVEGTKQSGAVGILDKDRLEKAINEHLLELGKTHRDAAEREVIDRKKHQLHVDHAFITLAMIYKRSHSGDALGVLRSVNDLERNYTYRLARRHWKSAQLAMVENDSVVVKENFFNATKFYLRSISRSVHTERKKIENELTILKSEIAAWKYKPADMSEIQGSI